MSRLLQAQCGRRGLDNIIFEAASWAVKKISTIECNLSGGKAQGALYSTIGHVILYA